MIIPFGVLAASLWGMEKSETLPLLELASGEKTTLARVVSTLGESRIILVGETHNRKSHHMAQLMVIKALHESGVKVAVGLEMFRRDSQKGLDRWVAGKINEKKFQEVYRDNWNYPWSFYAMIFHYARDMNIPLVGLNVPRSITQKVARKGFQSLTETEKGKLPKVVCEVDPDYMDFIRRAYGSHGHGQLNFTYFCEAQLVWDKVMAIHAQEYLEKNPDFSMILLTGSGHAWKKGIPEQIRMRSSLSYTVLLPGVPGHEASGAITYDEADYILLDLS